MAASFVRLSLIGLLVDLTGNSLLTLVLAAGKVRGYYLVTGLVSYLCLPLVWLSFKIGAPAIWAYLVFIIIYFIVLVLRLFIVRSKTGFPLGKFFRAVAIPLAAVSGVSLVLPCLAHCLLPSGFWRVLAVCLAAWGSMAVTVFAFALTPGERAFVTRKLGRAHFPDRIAVEDAYFEAMGRLPDLSNPRRYTEKLQWQKLHDHNPEYHALVDKAEVKSRVAALIGEEYVIPTLGVWERAGDIDWDSLPGQFVLKCTHDSGSTLVCTDKSTFDREAACRRLDEACRRRYWLRDREWAYKGVRPRIIAEKYMGENIRDYKFFCFNGEPKLMFVASDRASGAEETKFDFFDMDWNRLDIRNGHPNSAVPPSRPEHFEQMRELAAVLSRGMMQVRIDFYEIDGQVYFGEYTFYHWRGLVPFDPDEADQRIGELFKIR